MPQHVLYEGDLVSQCVRLVDKILAQNVKYKKRKIDLAKSLDALLIIKLN